MMVQSKSADFAVRRDLENFKLDDREDSPNSISEEKHAEKGIGARLGKKELFDSDCWDKLGYSWSTGKKWWVLCVIFAVQVSMNFNASVYASAVAGNPDRNLPGMIDDFVVSEQSARAAQLAFLIAYGFGCEAWAPWSEEIGRKPVLQASLFLVNIWQIGAGLSKNMASMVIFRILGGLSLAGGSVTLGLVADLYQDDVQQYAVAFVVLSSVGGSVVGPVVGGFVQTYLNWRWVFWLQLILGGAVQLLHLFTCPETCTKVLIDREAKRRRKAGEEVYGPGEVEENRFAIKKIGAILIRPYYMFLTEPIVLCLSLFSGFSDALIFTFLESYGLVFEQWNFSIIDVGLGFLSIGLGYLIAWPLFFPSFNSQIKRRKNFGSDSVAPEERLYTLLWLAPLLTIGLFGFAGTSMGPPQSHWIAPLIFSVLIGIANYAIYMATIDYMVAAYGPYAASATGGNGFARDVLAGFAAVYASPLYHNIGDKPLQNGSIVLGCLAVLLTIPIYIFYWKGPSIRRRSKFAQAIGQSKRESVDRRASVMIQGPNPV